MAAYVAMFQVQDTAGDAAPYFHRYCSESVLKYPGAQQLDSALIPSAPKDLVKRRTFAIISKNHHTLTDFAPKASTVPVDRTDQFLQ